MGESEHRSGIKGAVAYLRNLNDRELQALETLETEIERGWAEIERLRAMSFEHGITCPCDGFDLSRYGVQECAKCGVSEREHPAPATLTREEAEKRLIQIGFMADLDVPAEEIRRRVKAAHLTAKPILRAYVAHLDRQPSADPPDPDAPASEDERAEAARWAAYYERQLWIALGPGGWDVLTAEERNRRIEVMLPLVREARGEIERVHRSEAACVREALDQVGTLKAEIDALRARSAPVTPATDLLAARTALGLTIEQLADAVGYAPETLRRWEAARASLPKVLSMALAGMMRPAPLTEEEEAGKWALTLTDLEGRRAFRRGRGGVSRGDVPPEGRPATLKPEPAAEDFDCASCQHPEHARNEADDGITWCILCGDVLGAPMCGRIAPDGFPGAGSPCTLPAGHASGHEARAADGQLLAVSLPPEPGDVPPEVRALPHASEPGETCPSCTAALGSPSACPIGGSK